MKAISVAQLAIYIVLSFPVLFVLYKHGRPGLLGWIYLFAFCMLRVVGSALDISGSTSASLISSIGLSPLILGTSGILHEGREYLKSDRDPKMGWFYVLLYKMLVLGGLAILAVGSSALQGSHPKESDFTLVKVGISIIVFAWVVLLGWTVLTIGQRSAQTDPFAVRAGKQLTWAVLFALIFIGIRVVYTLVALVTSDPSLNPTTGSLTIRVVLSFLPDLISTLILVGAGFITRHIRQDMMNRGVGHELSPGSKGYQTQERPVIV